MIEIIDSRTKTARQSINSIHKSVISILPKIDDIISFSDILLLVRSAFRGVDGGIKDISKLTDLSLFVKNEFKKAGSDIIFTDADAVLLSALQEQSTTVLTGAKEEFIQKTTNILYASRSTPISSQLLNSVFFPSDIKGTGRSMLQVFETQIETSVMDAAATLMLQKGDEAGVTKYRYTGNLIKDSRPWCQRHLNKILTKDEIKLWAGFNWKGKNPSGDPFITRGGFRCRHHFAPVID